MDGNQEELLEYFGGTSELVEPGKTTHQVPSLEPLK